MNFTYEAQHKGRTNLIQLKIFLSTDNIPITIKIT